MKPFNNAKYTEIQTNETASCNDVETKQDY